MSRLDIVQPRPGNDGKTYWTKLGSAWPAKQGTGYSLTFEALPIPTLNDKGQLECRVLLREPLQRDGQAPAKQAAARSDWDDDDAGVPF